MTAEQIVVVGAGVVGCMAAREILERSPAAEVTVLERDAVGSGATRRSAGLHFPRGASARVREMAAASQAALESLAQHLPPGLFFPLRAALVASEGSEPTLAGVHLDSAKLARVAADPGVLLPEVEVPAGAAVFTIEGCHYADVHGLAQHLARALRERATVREGVRISAIEPQPDAVRLHLATGEELRADRVLLAPGPWIHDPAWRDLVAPLGLRVKRIVAMHVDRAVAEDDPVVVFPEEDAFLLPLRHRGHFLFSYTCQEWDLDPDGPVEGLSAAHLAEARACLARYAPALVDRCRAGRVFYDAYSPEREPRIETLDPAGRVVFAGAGNGSGYRLAPAMAAAAAALVAPASAPLDVADARSAR
jgi:glycine/D-amino acid oxidase-like deaminating enzyme